MVPARARELFPDIPRMSGITGCNRLPGKKLFNPLPGKLKAMEYKEKDNAKNST
jgi:hypothetical protein